MSKDVKPTQRIGQSAGGRRRKLVFWAIAVVLAGVEDNKVLLLAAVTPDLVKRGLHAGKLAGELAKIVGGGGGGRSSGGSRGGRR